MVYKNIDSKEEDIKILRELLEESSSEQQKYLIKKELKKLENGYKSEKDNAYYLNFNYDKDYYILLHDIRIEHNDKVAQIDHILITIKEIVILESKSFKGILTINNDGSLTVDYKKYKKTFPNPIEQNRRHMTLIKEFLEDKLDLPFRFKMTGGLPISSKVLIDPNTTITNKELSKEFTRSDSFFKQRQEEIEKMNATEVIKALAKILNKDLRKKIAQLLIENHKPVKIDYRKKFPIKAKKEKEQERKCPKCKDGNLILRKSKKENNKYKNNEFWGCSNFPKCRYTEELDI